MMRSFHPGDEAIAEHLVRHFHGMAHEWLKPGAHIHAAAAQSGPPSAQFVAARCDWDS